MLPYQNCETEKCKRNTAVEQCTPLARYSFCNPKRFKRNCFKEPAAVPFFEMSNFDKWQKGSADFLFACLLDVCDWSNGPNEKIGAWCACHSFAKRLRFESLLLTGKFIAERRPRLVILENVWDSSWVAWVGSLTRCTELIESHVKDFLWPVSAYFNLRLDIFEVRGLLAPNPETDSSPIDFILRGKNPVPWKRMNFMNVHLKTHVLTKENPEDCYQGTAPNADWGLSLIEGYGLRWDVLYSYDAWQHSCAHDISLMCLIEQSRWLVTGIWLARISSCCFGEDWGLPQGRPRVPWLKTRCQSKRTWSFDMRSFPSGLQRTLVWKRWVGFEVYIVMVRNDAGGQAAAERIFEAGQPAEKVRKTWKDLH